MIQEYLAFGTFIGALGIAGVALGKFFLGQFRNKGEAHCNSNCRCSHERESKLLPKPLGARNYHSFRLRKVK